MDLKGDVQHALPLAQPKLLKGIQLYFAELDIQSMVSLPLARDISVRTMHVLGQVGAKVIASDGS